MNNLKYEFAVKTPESNIRGVGSPQVFKYYTHDNKVRVSIYFMVNNALEIVDGKAISAVGAIRLRCFSKSPSGCLNASVKLVKVEFTFLEPQGMASNIEFEGNKIVDLHLTHPRSKE